MPPITVHASETRPRRRSLALAAALYLTGLGVALALVNCFWVARYDPWQSWFTLPLGDYYHFVLPAAALLTLAGVIFLERQPLTGLLVAILGLLIGWPANGYFLLPGVTVAAIWAARRLHAARVAVGFILLVPGVTAIFYALESGLSARLGVGLPGAPEPLVRAALAGQLAVLAAGLGVAWLGAWLLLVRPSARR